MALNMIKVTKTNRTAKFIDKIVKRRMSSMIVILHRINFHHGKKEREMEMKLNVGY